MTRIGCTYHFEAAHRLTKVHDGHKCRNLHGHNYRVEIVVEGELDERGFVCDFSDINAQMEPVLELVDHRYLNDVPGLENPTAEIIAAWIKQRVNCTSVRVYETDQCWAEVNT